LNKIYTHIATTFVCAMFLGVTSTVAQNNRTTDSGGKRPESRAAESYSSGRLDETPIVARVGFKSYRASDGQRFRTRRIAANTDGSSLAPHPGNLRAELTPGEMVETTLGGRKFPNGKLQKASVGGPPLFEVEHDATLKGDGTKAFPLGISVPLTLDGALTVDGLIKVDPATGNALEANGGDGTLGSRDGKSGVVARGGDTVIQFGSGGTGVDATGGKSDDFRGGTGVNALGGDTNSSLGGFGIISNGGNSQTGPGGDGLAVGGGSSDTGFGGRGIVVSGGVSKNARGGHGIEIFGGAGINGDGGEGLEVTGGSGSGSGHSAGNGITVRPGTPFEGASPGFAGEFIGDVFVSGTATVTRDLNVKGNLTKGGGSFKIDHPLDPANKYLYHSFVESPDMMNIYNGNVTTNKDGEATVELPDYFEALNRDFRYQLTVIGRFAQAIVAEKISGNHFRIKTSSPHIEVSWQVTGVRQDAYANAHRIPVEELKPEKERGSYLYPDALEQTENKGEVMTPSGIKPGAREAAHGEEKGRTK
jgi:hypothetical protein